MRPAFLLVIVAALLVSELPVRGQAPTAPPGDAEKGKKLFVERACWQCHGLAAQGGGIAGPRLAGRVPPWPAFSRYVRRPTEEMIPYTQKTLAGYGARGHLCLAAGDSIAAGGRQHPAAQS